MYMKPLVRYFFRHPSMTMSGSDAYAVSKVSMDGDLCVCESASESHFL